MKIHKHNKYVDRIYIKRTVFNAVNIQYGDDIEVFPINNPTWGSCLILKKKEVRSKSYLTEGLERWNAIGEKQNFGR